MKREYTTQNSHLMSLGKKRGVGELRERRWYYTAEELAELQAELDATRVNRSKAQKQTRRASLEAYRKRAQEAAHLAIEREVVKRKQEEEDEQAHRDGLARMYDHDYIGDKSVFAAVSFARKMIRTGTSPGLANYRAARYYDVDVSTVARYVGQVASKKRHKAAP